MTTPDLTRQRENTGRILSLDGVRGLAILVVTLQRFSFPPQETGRLGNLFWSGLAQGQRGVDLFFVLSGFLITRILLESRSSSTFFRDFYIRRTLRIFPLYYSVLFLCFVVLPRFMTASPYKETEPDQLWLWIYGTNIYQSWTNTYALGYFEHFWSLAVEEHYYLIWPWIVWLCSPALCRKLCLVQIAGALACRWWIYSTSDNRVAMEFLTPCRLDALALGGLLALGSAETGANAKWHWGLCALLAIIPVPFLLYRAKVFFPLKDTIFVGLCGLLILAALRVSIVNRFFSIGPLRTLGQYSYAMYVVQNPLRPWLPDSISGKSLGSLLGSGFFGDLVHAIIATAITFVIAWISWHVMEKHFLRLKDVLAPRRSG